MLIDIVKGTPFWVWPLLGLLIWRGFAATKEREMALGSLFVLPAVLLALSLSGIARHYGGSNLSFTLWAAGLALGGLAGWMTLSPDAITAGQRGPIVRGSWIPLVLTLAIFATKYTTEVMIAIFAQRMHAPDAMIAICLLYGLLNGLFAGRLARTVAVYQSKRTSPGALRIAQ